MTDTVKHMWDEVEKARADGTFSSEHAAVPAQGENACPWCGFSNGHHPWCRSPAQPASPHNTVLQPPAPRTPAEGDTVPVPKAALAWLFGEDAAPDGRTFGEDEDAEIATPRKYTRRYWWRSRFRSMIPALSQQHSSTMLTPEETK